MTTLFLFEDAKRLQLTPLNETHPTWESLSGTGNLKTRLAMYFPDLIIEAEVLPEICTDLEVCQPKNQEYLFINSRVLFPEQLREILNSSENAAYWSDGELVAVKGTYAARVGSLTTYLQELAARFPKKECTVQLAHYLWEYVYTNEDQIKQDAVHFSLGSHLGNVDPRAVLQNPENIWIGEGASIAPGVVLDATAGPIIISE